jgi:hypothetical protein
MIGNERKDGGEQVCFPSAKAWKEGFKSRLGIAGQG